MNKLTITGVVIGGIVGIGLMLITKDVGSAIVEFLTINILIQAVRIAKKGEE